MGIGLLGSGFMGKAHTLAYKSMPVYMGDLEPRLVAMYGRSRGKLERLAKTYGYERYYLDWRDLVRDDEVSVVDNSLPNYLHKEPCIEAMELGKNVVCEKPLARGLDEAVEMLRAAVKSGVTHGVVFNRRWLPAVRLARRLIDQGVIGKITHFRFAFHQDWAFKNNKMEWRFKKELAGFGVLGDQGSHVVDMIRFLVGEFKSVLSLTRVGLRERVWEDGRREEVLVDDVALVMARMKNGVIGTIEVSRFSPGRRHYFVAEVYGDEGSIYFDLERMNELWVYARSAPEVDGFKRVYVTEREHPYYRYFWPPGHTIGWLESFVIALHQYLKCVVEGREYRPSFADGAVVNAVIDAAYRSEREARFVDVRDTLV